MLVAIGRRARTDGMDLEVGDVKTDARGFIAIDEHQRTSNPRVFAAGDVSGAPQYVYVAAAAGRVAALNALAADPGRGASERRLHRPVRRHLHQAAGNLGRAHRGLLAPRVPVPRI